MVRRIRVFILTGLILAAAADSGMARAATEGAAQPKTEPASMPLPLRVVGTQILNSKNEPVVLRGVNCASLEWTSDGQGHILRSVQVAIDDWHVNHIRLPLAQDRRFGGPTPADSTGDDWLLHVMQALQDHHWSRTAWDFHPQAGPTLISDWNYTPTPDFGIFLKQMLAGTLPRYTPPAVPVTPPPPGPAEKTTG